MSYRLNRRSLENLKALIAAGKFVPDAGWSFSADDSNALLGEPPNWSDFSPWFLGLAEGKPDLSSDPSIIPAKDWYAYPYGKAGAVHLAALEEIATDPKCAADICNAAKDCLAVARAMMADRAKATSCDMAIAIDAAITIQAAADPTKGPPTFSMMAYTGGKLQLKGWQYPVVVDLAGMDGTHKSRPALRDHDQSKIVGHTTTITNSGKTLSAAGIVSGKGKDAEEVRDSGTSGFPWQASIGARVLANQFVPEGQTANANGQTWDGPVNIARRTSLGEISFVALGADDDTSARIAAQAAGANTVKKKFSGFLAALGFIAAAGSVSILEATQYDGLLAAFKKSEEYDAADKDAVDVKPPVQAAAKPAADGGFTAETRKELEKELRLCAATESKRQAAVIKATKEFPDIQAKAIEEGWDADRTELEVLRASRGPTGRNNVSQPFSINKGSLPAMTAGDVNDIVAAGACLGSNMPEKYALAGLSDKAKEIAASRDLRSTSFHGIMAKIAAMNGMHFPVGNVDMSYVRKMWAINAGVDLQIQAEGFSTMSLPGITENILNKAMLQAYGMVESVIPEIAFETDTNDFKTFKRYRLTASGDYTLVGPAGELKSMSLQDESYPNQVQTRGAIITLTRQVIINDDMGALTQAPTILGRKAALAREKQVFTVLLAGLTTLFPANNSRKNYASGAGSALGISSVTTAVKKFDEQTDANGDPISIEADRLFLPPALYNAGVELYKMPQALMSQFGLPSASSGTSAAQAAAKNPGGNIHAGLFRPVKCRYMSTAFSLTGSSDTGWILAPNPAGGMAIVQIGYLRGQRAPIIERGEAAFTTLGIDLRSYHDFGAALHDYRCGQYSAGV